MKALAPEISADQQQVQQQAKTNAEFGNRGGGTNASTQAAAAQSRGNIINLMGQTQTGAAGELSASGQNLLGQGMQGQEAGFGEASQLQQQRAAMWNDIFKSALAVGSAPFTGGASLGVTGAGGAGGGGFSMPDWLSSLFGGGAPATGTGDVAQGVTFR